MAERVKKKAVTEAGLVGTHVQPPFGSDAYDGVFEGPCSCKKTGMKHVGWHLVVSYDDSNRVCAKLQQIFDVAPPKLVTPVAVAVPVLLSPANDDSFVTYKQLHSGASSVDKKMAP